MRKVLVFIVLYILLNNCFAQNFSLDGNYPFTPYSTLDGFTLEGKQFTYRFEDSSIIGMQCLTEDCSIIQDNGMTFLKLKTTFLPEIIEENLNSNANIQTSDRMLILAGKTGSKVLLICTTAGFDGNPCSINNSRLSELTVTYKECSSYLTEGAKQYSINNLCSRVCDTPWVEGVPGYGIGESFVIENSSNKMIPYLLISNGYISYEKPYLYKQNSRIKQIKVTGLSSGKEAIIDVLDTPHLQTVSISFLDRPEDIKITIMDVYKGTKYDDTCIHLMLPWLEEVIPYLDSIE